MMPTLVYTAPAPVRVAVSDQKSVLMDSGDTITIEFTEERPESMTLAFDWDVDPLTLPARYKMNQVEGKVDIFFTSPSGERFSPGQCMV